MSCWTTVFKHTAVTVSNYTGGYGTDMDSYILYTGMEMKASCRTGNDLMDGQRKVICISGSLGRGQQRGYVRLDSLAPMTVLQRRELVQVGGAGVS